MTNTPNADIKIISRHDLDTLLTKELGSRASDLLLIPRDGADVQALAFDWGAAKAYYEQYCVEGNDCPDGQFDSDCTHFASHGLSKSAIIVDLPSATCTNGVCIRVAELAAAFKNSSNKYQNVKRIDDITQSREGDFCFVISWFGLSKDHVMILADTIASNGGRVYGHTNNRCGQQVDLSNQTLVVYRIE
jgi:hypothetical protein